MLGVTLTIFLRILNFLLFIWIFWCYTEAVDWKHKRSDWLIIVIVVRSKQWSIRVWGLLWMNSVCLSVFIFSLPKTFLLLPFSHFSHDQTLGQVIIRKYSHLAPWMLIFHYLMKNLLSVRLQFSHPCLLTLTWIKSTRIWTQPFSIFHKIWDYQRMSSLLRSLIKTLCNHTERLHHI